MSTTTQPATPITQPATQPATAARGELSLEVSRFFAATPQRVFDAWTADQWGQWVPPGGSTCQVESADFRPGGRYTLAMDMPDGRHIEITGKYLEIDRPHRLAMTWTGNYDGRETLLTVTFAAKDSGTLMTLRQEGFHEAQLQQGYTRGWTDPGGSFDKLAQLLS